MTALPITALRETVSGALSHPDAGAFQETAVLRVLEGRDARIVFDGADRPARVAFGCLVRPEPGDKVLLGLADGVIWIVAVLERPTAAPARLFAEGDIAITSAGGGIALLAARGVTIEAGAGARIAAAEIDLHAGTARFAFDELLHIGRLVTLYVAKLRSVGEMVETLAEHVLTRAKRGTRFIAESDELRAGAIDHRAEGNLQLEARTAFITAETVVRVDAEQIHMG